MVPEDHTNSAAQLHPQPQSAAQSRRLDQAGIQLQETPFQFGHMSAALPDASPANYQGNTALGRSQLKSSVGMPLRHQEHAHTTVFPTPPGPGVPEPQYPRQPYQQGRHTARFHPSYTGGLTTYSHPQSFGHPYPQQISHIQGHPAAYGHAGTGYYPIQQQYPGHMYDNTNCVVFRQEQNYLASAHTPAVPAIYGNVDAGLSGSALLQSDPTCKPSISLSLNSTVCVADCEKP